ncbi:hypothetical protein BOX15_Mlig034152g1 [Macrostomum lignano]|uniref:Uncharacterized protein n=1 Tax=Macrostomum lignano TaxID=282301 RepID=A0A267FVC6_9PLAT|nr:hypothetical protein BOX15_Mlig034152g1 [Macrostomum lignano]
MKPAAQAATVTDSSLRTANVSSLTEDGARRRRTSAETDSDFISSSFSGSLPQQKQQQQQQQQQQRPSECKLATEAAAVAAAAAAVHGDSCLTGQACPRPAASDDDSSMLLLYPRPSPSISSSLPVICPINAKQQRPPRGGPSESDTLWNFESKPEKQQTALSKGSQSENQGASIQNKAAGQDVEAARNATPKDGKVPKSSLTQPRSAEATAERPKVDLTAIGCESLDPVFAVLSLLPAPEDTFLSSECNPPAKRSPDSTEIDAVSAATSCPEDSISPPESPKTRTNRAPPRPVASTAGAAAAARLQHSASWSPSTNSSATSPVPTRFPVAASCCSSGASKAPGAAQRVHSVNNCRCR